MENLSFEEFSEFIRSWGGIPRKKRIALETQFDADLGITGDDGCDLLEATAKQFGVRLSTEESGYRDTFALGPNEFLFHSEGIGLGRLEVISICGHSPSKVRAFTVGELYEALQKALKNKPEKPT